MYTNKWQSQDRQQGVTDPFGDHAARSGSSDSSSSRTNRDWSSPVAGPSSQRRLPQHVDASPVLGHSNDHHTQGNQTPSEASTREFPLVASSSNQPPAELERHSLEQSPTALESSSGHFAYIGKGKAPEQTLHEPSIGATKATQVPRSSSLTQRATRSGQIGDSPVVGPPLTLNEKTAREAADAINPKIIKRGERKVWIQKQLITFFDFSANFILIFSSWYWPQYYYIYLPFISLPLVLNCIMICMIIIYSIKNLIRKPKKIIPTDPENMILLMPCYNESFEECTRSLDSLTSQVDIDHHKKAIMIVCDGRARGPGMQKTTAQYLAEDILAGPQTQRFMIRAAYLAWDGQTMDVECLKGVYKGVPFFCVNKQHNQGKRDSLIVSRSFVFNFNRRTERPKVVFAPAFFNAMAEWLQNDADFDRVDILIGMDADTIFDPDCISHLVAESHYPHTVGVCGYVAVDFLHGNWNLWSVYQSAEYTIAQALRRLHQSMVTHKVSCLPGCCQLLKVCEETCGDRVLIDLFGYHPKPTDGVIRRIRATASEDRNHVCLMLMENPKAQTRQALRARAYTDVPHSLRVFLSQRRRWTLGATSNDLMLFTKAPLWRFNWWERIVAFSNVLTWLLNPFVIASLGCMVYAFLHQPWWIVLIFASIMIIPLLYYITMIGWMPRNTVERLQFILGLSIFTICGPFINIGVTLYAIWNMSNFGWGKTRKVITEAETGEAEEPIASEQQTRLEEALNLNEKVVGSQIPDTENQLGTRAATPYTAEPPRPRLPNALFDAQREISTLADQPHTQGQVHVAPSRQIPASASYSPRQCDDPFSQAPGSHDSTSSGSGRNYPSRPFSGAHHSPRDDQNHESIPNPFGTRPAPLNINRAESSDHSLNFRPEDFQSC